MKWVLPLLALGVLGAKHAAPTSSPSFSSEAAMVRQQEIAPNDSEQTPLQNGVLLEEGPAVFTRIQTVGRGSGEIAFWISSVPNCPVDLTAAFSVLASQSEWVGAQIVEPGEYVCARSQPGSSGGTVKWWSTLGEGGSNGPKGSAAR